MIEEKLFIVDDDKVIITYLKGFFSQHGWDVETFTAAKDLLKRLNEELPRLIITDLDMPDMDGIELIQELKSNADANGIPVLVMTALHENHVRLQSFRAGAIHFVNKPVNPYELEAVVKSVLSQMRQTVPQPIMSDREIEERKDSVETWVEEAKDVVMLNIANPDFSLNELAAALNYSRSAVQKRIKQFTGLSVSKFIRAVRLEESLQHLASGEVSISEAAVLVGFRSHSYYTRCFKEYYGVDPVKKKKMLLLED